jgi:hypothetical protein
VRELLVRLAYKRRNYRKRLRAHFTGGDRRFFGVAVLVLLTSLLRPYDICWYLGETGGIVVMGLLLAATIILIPVALVFF